MADVFISYSRKDTAFVRTLHDAFVAAQRDPWVDWEDIPLTAKFLAEIYAAIEAADTYIFVISPDAVVSHYCLLELAHAVENNKRLIPVVRRDAPPEQIPAALAELNWIFLREGDDFPSTFQVLLDALDTDLAWVKAHTRLLTRALEWEKRAQNPSYLLRGQDLAEAEATLARVTAATRPQPTPLQSRYVLASRRAATRGQRTRLGAVSVALVVALVLAVVAAAQRNEARQQQRRATAQATIALGRQLAVQAGALPAQNPALGERSILLAIESLQRTPSVEANQALRSQLALLRPRLWLVRHEQSVRGLAVSSDGTLVATAGYVRGGSAATARVWDAASGRELLSLPHDDSVSGVLFSSDGRLLATRSRGVAQVWELPSGKRLAAVSHDNDIRAMAFSRDGRLLATVGFSERVVRVWEAVGGREVARLVHEGNISALTFSPTEDLIATSAADGTARVWEAATGDELARMTHPVMSVSDVAFSPDGRLVASGDAAQSIRLWRPHNGAPFATIAVPADERDAEVRLLAFAPNTDETLIRLAAAMRGTISTDFSVRVWQASSRPGERPLLEQPSATFTLLTQVQHTDRVDALAFSPDGRSLATGSGSTGVSSSRDATARVWDVFTGHELVRLGHGGNVTSVAFTPDGRRLATSSMDGTARLWDLAARGEPAVLNYGLGEVQAAAFSPDGAYVATGGFGGAQVRDAVSGDVVFAALSIRRHANAVAFSPDGRYLAIGWTAFDDPAGNLVEIWNYWNYWNVPVFRRVARVAQGSPVQLLAFGPYGRFLASASGGPGEAQSLLIVETFRGAVQARVMAQAGFTALAVSPDGRYLAAAGFKGPVLLLEAPSGREVARLPHEPVVKAIAFSPDGTRVVTGGTDKTARVWETATGRELARMEHGDYVNALAFSPDGRLVASGSGTPFAFGSTDRSVRLWEANGGRAIGRFIHDGVVNAVAFSADGKQLVSTSEDRTARVWDVAGGRELTRVTHAARRGGSDRGVIVAGFSADGRRLITVGADDAVRVSALRDDDLIAAACARVTGNLTADEWRQYIGDEPYHKTCPALP